MKTIKTEAIILSSKNMFEKDKIIELFSPELGRTRVLAKSANTSKFKYQGRLEATNHVHLVLYKGKSFDLITNCDILTYYPNLRNDFNKISLTFYFFDIIKKATAYQQHNKPLFNLLINILATLNKLPPPPQLHRKDLLEIKNCFHSDFMQIEGISSTSSPITDATFQNKFEEYARHTISPPRFI